MEEIINCRGLNTFPSIHHLCAYVSGLCERGLEHGSFYPLTMCMSEYVKLVWLCVGWCFLCPSIVCTYVCMYMNKMLSLLAGAMFFNIFIHLIG